MTTREIVFAAMTVLASTAVYCGLHAQAAPDAAERVLRHVVLFKFKDGTTDKQVAEVVAAFKALPAKIGAIKGFEYGTDVSVENRAQGFTHCFLVTFADEAGRDAYLPHPAHKEFGTLVGPLLDQVLVVDYRAQR
jgi:hypothetical protein